MVEYMEMRRSEAEMSKRLENLKKIISPREIDECLLSASMQVSNHLEALYIAYYKLKDKYSNVKRWNFGTPKVVRSIWPLNVSCHPREYTWEVLTQDGTHYGLDYETQGYYTIANTSNTVTLSNTYEFSDIGLINRSIW